MRRTPIVVILGSTAVGKTKLSIELAKKFNGEIISADSMQIYRGLDISTAKATRSEQAQAPHHMLDVCDVTTKAFTVVDFRDAALPIIDRLQNVGRMPIVVGGTTYYIESLLWQVLVAPPRDIQQTESDSDDAQATMKQVIPSYDEYLSVEQILEKLSPNELKGKDPSFLHRLLTEVDPMRAQQLHPNDTRKVRRALEIYMNTGEAMSEHLSKQKSSSGSSALGGPLRYENVIMFWLKSDQTKLNARIDARIDGMVAQGLIYETRKCFNLLRADLAATAEDPDTLDLTIGMMQAIGFKEFVPYLQTYRDEQLDVAITEFIKSHGGRSGSQNRIAATDIPEGLELLESCLEELRLRTKRYAKKQVKWVQNRLIQSKGRLVPPLYILDATNAETNWHSDVYAKAENVVQSYIDGIVPTDCRPNEQKTDSIVYRTDVTHFCEVCDRRFVGDYQWNEHLKSTKHSKVMRRIRKAKLNEAKRSLAHQSVFRRLVDALTWCFISIKNRLLRR